MFCILDKVSGPAVIASNKASTGFPLFKNKSAATDKLPVRSNWYNVSCKSVIVTKLLKIKHKKIIIRNMYINLPLLSEDFKLKLSNLAIISCSSWMFDRLE